MATLRDIKRRIGSVRSTRQITSAMKMVSTAKLSRAQAAVRAARPFSDELRRMVIAISRGLSGQEHPLFQAHEGGKSVVLLYTSDRGLCGAFNTNVNRALLRLLTRDGALPDPELIVFGRVGNDYFRKRGFPIAQAVLFARHAERAARVREIIRELTGQFIAGEVGRVFLAYNHFRNPISQQPQVVPLLPISPPEDGTGADRPAGPVETREMLFEPSIGEILDVLLPRYLENQCFVAHLNTEAGENGARMVAMDGATRNADQMIKNLTLQYNRVRQAAITKELIEIVNGAQAQAL
jgi:F-type H+-transporting ATPase subunit gamma